ncbi:MAG: hypothetical protein WAS07_00685 [Micropruina sp.]
MQHREPPTDPFVRQLVSMMNSGHSRRSALKLGGAAALAAALSACAPPAPPLATGSAAAPAPVLPVDVSATEKTVNFANWTAYLDYDEDTKKYPTLEAFMKKTGIKVAYTEDVDDNDTYFNKIAPQLRAKQDIKRDIFTFTELSV